MSSREEILEKLKNSCGIKDFVPEITKDPVSFIKDDVDMFSEFKNRIVENKSILHENTSDIASEINTIIENEGVKNLIYPSNLPIDINSLNIENKFEFNKNIEEFKEKIFEYDVSIIQARFGVSSHGVLCISASKEQPRTLSLTPRVCIALLKKENIVKSLSEALNKIKEQDGRLPTNTIFISGPSRTSDIELQLVIGVHGSQIMHVILY
ncbi:Uncharacterised ACR, YkgG family COG1556 [Campylobacter sputorum subsp. bubulus]|uniref:Uncharacterized ACR, YkgG family COG1556 n=1 Tax=Campylobacter sputorum subsp. sputorum TaxID=32024 RepID=A0A381DHN8_9BACT|nr:lactate utilization protein C [Campylobacter sputorum]ASM35057.1 NAD-independent L-lactate dehydrogenase LldEFG, subunit LldG [Campylobacter sputorum aubsp. sputorum RM3237]ASM36724.1 NAD-independent L-lactate dehydrogenase LldEFG, subunit LldG [Campylobacter sputorum bv. faecalis CCUG 20703]ASM38412.1 NAD-independent L-lactate dehydrogenase LldEFG, subunit LldG [Campylobacter sputorum bv. paraureolyticus LMG 11764]KAB0581340.1 lactate utilization protein C [Campylobacter sputorum subsp. spu